jgi:TfoX/Sxy family transcriptional regulator of competence genes
VPYDEDLANRVREQLADVGPVTEKRMFGGLAFLVGGNMAVSVSRDDLLVRVGPEATDDALAREHVRPFEMGGGRRPKGWVKVAPEGLRTQRQLAPWVKRGVAFAQSLPPKP